MAQHDYVIANQGFPAFRSDLNDALAAIVSNNSGATEPTTMFAHQMWVDTAANPSVLKIRNADNDAWITIGSIDQTGDTFTLVNLRTSGPVVFNDAGADVDFRVEGDTDANLLFVDASADKVGIGTSSPNVKLFIKNDDSVTNPNTGVNSMLALQNSNSTANNFASINFDNGSISTSGIVGSFERGGTNAGNLQFHTRNSSGSSAERARITSGGNLLVGTTASPINDNVVGTLIGGGTVQTTASGQIVMYVNRKTNDGDVIAIQQDSISEGSISVSGGTVSYNPFLGSHAGALADWSRPDIKIGTVMDTINELLEYKVVVIDVQEEVPAKEAVLDEEGNEVEPAQEATIQTVQKRISYNGNGAVGSSATIEYEGQEYTGTIEHERKEPLSFNKHLKVKVNDTAASKAVFGVFVGWNNSANNDGGVYNDMLVGAVGNYVIRMAAGQEPQVGDLVEADGNGCAVVQDDDIIRTKTIAKVTSTIPQVTYDDGSFLVTCVLYCG